MPDSAPTTLDAITADDLLATLRAQPAGETPTPDPQPAEAPPDESPPAEAQEPPAGAPQRDAQGRFLPRGEAPPAAAQAEPPPPAAPDVPTPSPADTPPPAKDDSLAARLAELERVNTTLRGQVDNAARQAEERGKQAARQFYRDEVRAEYRQMVANGEATPEQVQAALAAKEEQWQRQDFGTQQQALGQERVDLALRAQQTTVDQATIALYHRAAPQLAQDHGLDVEQVRAVWADEGERQRFQRAAHQAEAAKKFPTAGFNASALEDYLETTNLFLARERALGGRYAQALQTKDAEIARLTKELNRADAAETGLYQAEPASRGGAPRRAPREHLADITTDDFAEALTRARARAS